MNKVPGSDEEDDLESLRLAALQTLKKNAGSDNINNFTLNSEIPSSFRGKGTKNKWGRFGSQRHGKNGHFSRHRNTNLIPITPIGQETVDSETKQNLSKVTSSENLNADQTSADSKFTRYNKSDSSESESEEPIEEFTLKKSGSLEALMEELDKEIKGKAEDDSVKPKKEKKKQKPNQTPVDSSQTDQLKKDDETTKAEENKTSSKDVAEESLSSVPEPEKTENKFDKRKNFPKRQFQNKSPNSRFIPKKRRMFSNIAPPAQMIYNPNPFGPPVMPFINCNPMFIPTNQTHPPPLYYDRPLSPLSINAESLTTATMAPLSPRSARFVLENKAIIERRKRSPRRSYSRSRSRSLSRSPRYSPSPPRRFRRSVSPRRSSRSPRRFSPRKRSLSPRRKSLSPKRDTAANTQGRTLNKIQQKMDKPEVNKSNEPVGSKNDDEKILDPILLARKKKFESNEIKKKEGIIRLRPKEEKFDSKADIKTSDEDKKATMAVNNNKNQTLKERNPERPSTNLLENEKLNKKSDEIKLDKETKVAEKSKISLVDDPLEFQELEKLLNDDAPLDDIVQPKVVDIFSDEESDSDNEGRFKMKQKRDKVPVLSFSKLINGTKQEIKADPLPDSSGYKRSRERRNKTSSKPREIVEDQQKSKTDSDTSEQSKRQKITYKSEAMASTENRLENKIEIKIKNPAKYEKTEKKKSKIESFEDKSKVNQIKEVEINDEQLLDDEEIIIEQTDSGDEENTALSDGDLRTQLSRKRAERLYKTPAEVSTRLLKYALQGAVFKKTKKKSKKKSSSDGKLPIHLRLGISGQQDLFEDVKVKKKSKKRKTREVMEQVYFLLLRDN